MGGALAANEPAGDYPAACLALGATVHTTTRTVPAAEFFVSGRTVLEPGEIITAATFPISKQAAYIKFLNPAARYAMVGVFASCAADGLPHIAVTACSRRVPLAGGGSGIGRRLRFREFAQHTSVAGKFGGGPVRRRGVPEPSRGGPCPPGGRSGRRPRSRSRGADPRLARRRPASDYPGKGCVKRDRARRFDAGVADSSRKDRPALPV